jgi:DNA-binding NtrC family response regulator
MSRAGAGSVTQELGTPAAPGQRTVAPSSAADRREPHRSATSGQPAAAPSARYSFFGVESEEREAILAAMTRCRGNRTRAAAELGMARNTLREKLRKYGLSERSREAAENG